jgi:hypothetical protein
MYRNEPAGTVTSFLQSDAAALGTATTSSQTFGDVGNGSTTGYSAWTVNVPSAKTYLLLVNVSFYIAGAVGSVFFQILVDGATTGVTNPANAAGQTMNVLSSRPRQLRPLILAEVAHQTSGVSP